MRAALVVVLLVTARSALGDPPDRAIPCKPSGTVLFEVDQRADAKRKLVTATTRLYRNGAWRTQVIDVDGKPMRSTEGCLAPDALAGVRDDLTEATWKVVRTQLVCREDSRRVTVYRWNGKPVYTERSCNTKVLDPGSLDALVRIRATLRVPDDLDGQDRRGTRLPSMECRSNPLANGCM